MQGSLPAAALVFSYSYWIAKLSWFFLKELKGLDLKTVMYSLPSSIAYPPISHHMDEGQWSVLLLVIFLLENMYILVLYIAAILKEVAILSINHIQQVSAVLCAESGRYATYSRRSRQNGCILMQALLPPTAIGMLSVFMLYVIPIAQPS